MKLRLISIALGAGVLAGCAGGLGFMNLAMVPVAGAVGAGAAAMGSAPGVGAVTVAANSTLHDSVERHGNPEVGAFPFVVTGDLSSYGLPLVGNYESYNEVFAGRVVRNLSDDSEMLAIVMNNTGVTCEGRLNPPDDGWPTEFPLAMRNCLNRLARGTLQCSDGRMLELDWRATQCRTAYGEGFDRDGGTVQFMVLDDGERAAAKAQLLIAQLESYPPLPLPAGK
jgi:hypothetical protein